MNYHKGLEALSAMIDANSESWLRFEGYRAQLIENLSNEREYGSTEQLRHDRFRIIGCLNELCHNLTGYVSFTELCLITRPIRKSEVRIQTSEYYHSSEGNRLFPPSPEFENLPISEPTVPSEDPVFLQTIKDRLRVIRNDYSSDELLFQTGADLPLVDSREFGQLSESEITRIARARAAHVEPILKGGSEVPSVAIVIPVFGGAHILAECLFSITRQSLVQRRGNVVQIVIVEDGIPEREQSVYKSEAVIKAIASLKNCSVLLKCLRLQSNHGRAQARNVGLANVDQSVVVFMDASMVLDSDFLTEHMWRHSRIPDAAFLGFKENIDVADFDQQRVDIVSGLRRPDFRQDLKCLHRLSADEAGDQGFHYRGEHFRTGDTINYMKVSEYLKGMTGIEAIGRRTLASFFQTNIVSAKTESILNVGGFEPLIQGWGLEDTFLGALLAAKGCHLIPCPSSVAFNLESPPVQESAKQSDLTFNRLKYEELLTKTRMAEYSKSRFYERIAFLTGKVDVVDNVSE